MQGVTGRQLSHTVLSGSMTPGVIKLWEEYMAVLITNPSQTRRVGMLREDETANPNKRYELRGELRGGVLKAKETVVQEIAVLAAASAKKDECHLILLLTKADGGDMVEAINKLNVPEKKVLLYTSDTRAKGGLEFEKKVQGWERGDGEVKILVAMQPFVGIDPVSLWGTDIAGSWNILCAYQGGERGGRGYTSDGKREKVVTRYWNWDGLERWLKDGEDRRKQEVNLPGIISGSFEVTAESYLRGWNKTTNEFNETEHTCLREWLGKGRSEGGMTKCPQRGKGVLMCSVCDMDGMDYVMEFGEGGEERRGSDGAGGKRDRDEGGDGGGRKQRRVESDGPVDDSLVDDGLVTRRVIDEDEVRRNQRNMLGNSCEGNGERRWSDNGLTRGFWRCGSIGAEDKYVGGCGQVNPNIRDKGYFQCLGCNKGKAGKRKDGNRTPSPHSSFTCGCKVQGSKRPGSLTFYTPSDENLVCGVCKEERGEWDWEFGYNRGLLSGWMYLGRFNGERKWEGVRTDGAVFVREKRKGLQVKLPEWAQFEGETGGQVH